jgi:hypothetical protein
MNTNVLYLMLYFFDGVTEHGERKILIGHVFDQPVSYFKNFD